MQVMDQKYVVFKREGFELEMDEWNPPIRELFEELIVSDATVIRGQDLFASAALHTYANSISIAARIMGAEGHVNSARRLQEIADYFHLRAAQAEEIGFKVPD